VRIASLHKYPVKGMRAVDVQSATVEMRGFQHDRRWLVVDANGEFLTQRSTPQIATMTVTLTASGLKLFAEGFGEIVIDQPSGVRRQKIVIWGTEVDAAATDQSADTYISEAIGKEAHLVFMDEKAQRLKTSEWTPTPVPVSFADAFPVLVTTTGSLAKLNHDIEEHNGAAVPMARFRPNVVVDCDEAWAEDRWAQLRIGNVTLDLVKLSDRCIVTTTDQKTGERTGKEPLASLARIHRSKDPRIKGVLFGVNAVPGAPGEIRVGDSVEVVD
jgi:uncharacterized protein YcbX